MHWMRRSGEAMKAARNGRMSTEQASTSVSTTTPEDTTTNLSEVLKTAVALLSKRICKGNFRMSDRRRPKIAKARKFSPPCKPPKCGRLQLSVPRTITAPIEEAPIQGNNREGAVSSASARNGCDKRIASGSNSSAVARLCHALIRVWTHNVSLPPRHCKPAIS